MGLTLDSRTKNFIREVNNLVEKGVVKNYAEVIKEIGYNKTAMSSVMNGKLNIPTHIYAKFKEVYKESFPEDYRDEQIAFLKDQNQFLRERINELQRKLDEITNGVNQQLITGLQNLAKVQQTSSITLAYAKTLYLSVQEHRAALENTPLKKVRNDMDKVLASFAEKM
jgi:hypothetical protein